MDQCDILPPFFTLAFLIMFENLCSFFFWRFHVKCTRNQPKIPFFHYFFLTYSCHNDFSLLFSCCDWPGSETKASNSLWEILTSSGHPSNFSQTQIIVFPFNCCSISLWSSIVIDFLGKKKHSSFLRNVKMLTISRFVKLFSADFQPNDSQKKTLLFSAFFCCCTYF
jgi:hypothetical protein